MHVFRKRPVLTQKQQEIIYELNDKIRINFKNQSVYKDKHAFNKAIKILQKIDFVRRKDIIENGCVKSIIVLELQGLLYYGDVLSKLMKLQDS